MIGKEIHNYKIVEKIGEGGMATVYKAVHKSVPGMMRAIKTMHPVLSMDPVVKTKFINEASTMASLDHPNIVKIFDYEEQNDNLFLVMEYVEGVTIDEMIRTKTGPIPEERASKIFLKILDAIGYAHSRGIIHRDIKPSNIIISGNDEPKIIDFGIVKILEDDHNPGKTKTGTRIGTPLYMSPEQILAKGIDQRSDIYALGVTLYQMIAGSSPYDHTLSEFEIQTKIVNEPLPRIRDRYPAASEKIQTIIDRATAKQKEHRYGSCEEFKKEFSRNDIQVDATAFVNAGHTPENQPLPPVVKPMFSNSFSFDGRIRRTEYCISIIILFIAQIIVGGILAAGGSFIVLAYIPILWFSWAQGAKRCHDVGQSGWYQIIPFYVLWMIFQDSNRGANAYGKNPKGL